MMEYFSRLNQDAPGGFRWMTFHLLVLIWVPVAIAGIYAKWAILRIDGFSKTATSLGRSVTPLTERRGLFTAGEQLSFFRWDLLLCIVAVPLILLLLSRWKNAYLLSGPLFAISALWILVINVQLDAFRFIGRFQSWEMLDDAVKWGLQDSRQAESYIVGMAVFRLISLVLVALLAFILVLRRWRLPARWRPAAAKASLGVWIVLLGITASSWLSAMPPTASHASIHLATVAQLLNPEPGSKLGQLSQAALNQRYRRISSAPDPNQNSAFWAAAPDYDVLFFVLETTPKRCLAFDAPIDDLPNMREIRDHAWVGAQHYSTYPITSRAIFSLMTSLYPPESTRDLVRLRDHVNTGLVRNLTAAGYRSGVYGSSASIAPWAKDVFENLGFTHLVAVDEGLLGLNYPVDPHVDQQFVAHQLKLDALALDRLKTDMTGWIQNNQRYMALYLPQLSHGPWGDIRSNGQESNLITRCRNLAIAQDQWLGDLLNLLRNTGRLNRTLIIVTGDHGIRSSIEDPAFPLRVNDEYSFAVPFMLYAPGVLKATQTLPWVTSHIDVAPSILDLLGIVRNRDSEQGIAIWDQRITQRTTFFLANQYHGSDGYYSDGKYYSWNRAIGITYAADRLHFEYSDVTPANSPVHKAVIEKIQALDEIRDAWFRASQK